MSWQAMKWAVAQKVGSHTDKVVLLVIAEAADGANGSCTLSHATIAHRAELGVRTVGLALERLESRGKISRRHRHKKNGARTSDEIALVMSGQTARDAGRCAGSKPQELPLGDLTAADDTPNRSSRQNLTARRAEEPGVLEPVEEPGVSPLTPHRGGEVVLLPVVDDGESCGFERWWSAYPRKADKKDAEKIFTRLVKRGEATVEQLVEGANRYAKAVQGRELRYVRLPTTWLNKASWTNEHEPASHGPQHQNLMAMTLAVRRDS